MKIFAILFLSLFFFSPVFAQVDDIKDKSKNNREKQNDESENLNSSNSSSFGDVCAEIFVEVAFALLYDQHLQQIANKANDPTAFSLDVMPHFAFSPDDNYFNFLPRIRGTWGVLSTDFRMNYLLDFDEGAAETFRTIEWQVLQFNIVPVEEFTLRFSTGLMYEEFTGNLYNEHYLGLCFRLDKQKILATLEGRFTYDYNAQTIEPNVFYEINLRGAYRILDFKNLWGYATFGILYQNYYQSVEMLSVQGGLTFNIH